MKLGKIGKTNLNKMDGKLIKTEVNYLLENEKGVVIASTSLKKEGLSLSLKNCQAIGDEYDEAIAYASEFGHPSPEGFSDEQIGRLHGFIDGFQKALEILGDKKFSEEDVKKAILFGEDNTDITSSDNLPTEEVNKFIQSLQQTEWDVEIMMEEAQEIYRSGVTKYIKVPKLDADGCLILKRK